MYFCFVFLPVLVCSSFKRVYWFEASKVLMWVIAFVGVVFAFRHLYITGFEFSRLGNEVMSEHEFYLSSEPSVLFSAVFLVLRALDFKKPLYFLGGWVRVFIFLAGLLSLIALAAKGHRGPIFLASASYCIFLILAARNSIWTILTSAVLASALSVYFLDTIMNVFSSLLKKNEARGINGRDQEFYAVVEAVGDSTVSIFFGNGFGSKFYNPAAGGGEVNFAHVSLSWALLKGGILGVLLFSCYVMSFIRPLLRNMKLNMVLFLSLMCPFFIGLLINGSYRMLCFGFLLFICLGSCEERIEFAVKPAKV